MRAMSSWIGAARRTLQHPADRTEGAERGRFERLAEYGSFLIRTGGPHVSNDISPQAVNSFARDEEHLKLLREVGASAVIIVPMMTGARPIGAITLASAESVRRLSPADLVLAEELGRRAGTAVENGRIHTERARIAHTLQQALLPQSLPAGEGIEVHALYQAAGELNEIGADFYDVLELDGDRWLLAIGDVGGKRPRAAGQTALARHTLRAAAISGQQPAAMLATLHQAIRRQPSGESLCTACVVMMERGDDHARLTIALGGHQPPLLLEHGGAVAAIGRPGTLLGAIDPIEVHETQADLHVGDTLLLYTDGVTDAGRADDRLGELGLRALCADATQQTLPELLERITDAALTRAAGRPRDDIMLLALRLSAR